MSLSHQEFHRLQKLHETALLDSLPETAFDDLARLAAQVCVAPVGFVSFVDEKRQWFKAGHGWSVKEAPRELSFCTHVLSRRDPLIVSDATQNPLFADNPLVTGPPHIRFYAGAPLILEEGVVLGALAVADFVTRDLSSAQRDGLQILARQVVTEIRLRAQQRADRSRTAVQAQNTFLANAQRIAGLGTWHMDLKTGRLTWSDATCAIFGISPDRFSGKLDELLEQIVPEDRDRVQRSIEDNPANSSHLENEYRIKRADGAIRLLYQMGNIEYDDKGAPKARLGVVMDITWRKEAERTLALREHETKELEDKATSLARRLQTTFESITDGFFTLDPEWAFSFLNAEAERLLQRPRKDLIGRNVWEAFPEAVGSAFERQYRKAMSEGKSVAFEEYFGPLDAWFEVNAYPSEEGLAVYFRNVTHRKRAEEAFQATLYREQAARREANYYSANLKKAHDRLAQNATLLNMTLRIGRMGAWWIDLLPSPTVHWTPAIYEIFGLPDTYVPEVEHVIERFIPAHRAALRTAFEACVDEGKPYNLECQLILPDGSLRWTLSMAEAVRDEAGRVVRIQGALQDISDQKKVAEESRQLESRLFATLESMTDAFYMLDKDWRFSYINAEGERLLRHARADVLGKHVWETFPQAVGTILDKEYHRARETDRAAVFEFDYPPLGVLFDVRAFPFEDGLAVYFRDITESKQVEAKLREQAELLDKARDAIFVRDLQDRILYWNAGAARIYGWSKADVVSSTSERGLYLDDSAFRRATKATLEKGEWTGRFEQRTREGTPITVEGRWTLVRDEKQNPFSILAIHTDITEGLRLEQQFLRSQRMESIGTLAGGIAHDLNNLLSPIVMGSDLLSERIKDPRALSILADIGKSARRGSDLVKQVLSFARGIEGARVPVHLDHLIREISAIIATTFPKNIHYSAHTSPDLWPIMGDPTQLNQVLLNLCVNARDAMPQGGRLLINAHNTHIEETFARANDCETGPAVLLEVIDEGSGIRKELVDRVFEPFFTTKDVGKGTGLGLSTVLGIVRSHQGTVTLDSEEGLGSVFKIYLPAHVAPTALADASPEPQERARDRGRGQGILLVDDESAILSIASETLEAFGYRVFAAENGAQALRVFEAHGAEIAVVLTDMMMPVMDGPTLIAALRKLDPDLPVIAASGMNGNGDMDRAEDAGARHFLAKPYTADQLLAALSSVFQQEP